MRNSLVHGFRPLLAACFILVRAAGAAEPEPVPVLVSVPPYATIVEALGGELVEVQALLRPGDSHESFAPPPSRVWKWAPTELYWATGLDFEQQWLPKLRSLAPAMRVIGGEEAEVEPGHGDHAHAHEDPHRWLDPREVREQAAAFTAALVELRPAEAPVLRERLRAFEQAAGALHAEIEARLQPYRGARIYLYHGALDHFAEAYGLKQVALQQGGRAPSLRRLADLIEQARDDGARAVFVQPQESPAAAAKLARAIGADLVTIDPLAADWEANLRRISLALERDLSGREAASR